MNPDQHAALRDAGRRKAAELPPVSPECARRVAELLAAPINEFVKAKGGRDKTAQAQT